MRLLLVFFLLCSSVASAQTKKKGFSLFKKKKKAAAEEVIDIHLKSGDLQLADECVREGHFVFGQYFQDIRFAPSNCERTHFLPDSSDMLSEIYLANREHFAVWDSRNVAPYDFDRGVIKDSAFINLYCQENGQYWSYPVNRQRVVNSDYGPRRYRFHHGIDLDITVGEPVFSVFDGVVRIAKYNYRGYGYYVMVRHDNGLETLYGHLKYYNVKPGDVVKAGQQIGLAGNSGRSTGPHLHFETRYQGYAFDPNAIFDFANQTIKAKGFLLTSEAYKKLIEEHKAVYHRIRSGDSLWLLARRYRTSITRICRLNNISRRTTLRVGRRLRVR